MLDVDAGNRIGGADAPFIVTVRRFQAQNARSGMRVAGADPAGLHFRGARCIHIEPGTQRVVHWVADFESIQQVVRVARAPSRDVQASGIVLHHFRQCRQALLQEMRVGDRNVADFLRGQSLFLRRVLRVDLICRRAYLHLFVQLLRVFQGQGDLVLPAT